MRAVSLPNSLLAAYARGSRSAFNAPMAGTTRLDGSKVLGDAVIAAVDGSIVGDTADVSTLPLDYADGLASGKYYLNASVANASAALPGGSGAPSSWLSAITDALPKVGAFVNAQQIAQVNAKRAAAGLPALPASQYAPSIGVAVDPNTTRMLTYAALGVAAFFVLPKILKRS